MKRRDFIKLSSAAGVAGVVGSRLDAAANPLYAQQAAGFDLHPFIKAHPEAVFIYLTDIKEKTDKKGIYDASYKLASEMFVSTSGGKGYSNSTKIASKPNWTCAPQDKEDPLASLGIDTDLNFVEGYLSGVKAKGPQQVYIRESACPNQWEPLGYADMAKRNNFDLKNLTGQDPWDLGDDIIYKVVDGVVFKEVAYMAPITALDAFHVNLAKFKTHGMGVTGAIKNLQGTCARRFSSFCGGYADIFRQFDKKYHPYWQPNYLAKVKELQTQHIEAGYPRWNEKMDKPPFNSGFWMEQWAQRMCDAYSGIPIKTAGISVIEGIYGRDGDGFQFGPHNGKAMDYMCNNTIFGIDPFRLDIIAHWLAGHEPGNFGLFHIGIERGLSDVLDPFDIPIYLWKNGKAKKIKLDKLTRTPLVTYYNQKAGEDRFHLCNEPFDYKSWKSTGKIAINDEPSIKAIGTDSENHIVMDMNVPQKGDVYVDILNSQGELVWRMHANDLEPGNHQVVWDGFCQPGMYNAYVKGMGWDAERQMVIYA
ncbi:MAG: DUF362 domain-containing protein [Bacteroidales bacterium]|jgi:hypothetical protein|nr:DUF362 domain-containing protein [Bacteroidales bacterium]